MRDATQKWPLFQSDLEIGNSAAALFMLTHDVTTPRLRPIVDTTYKRTVCIPATLLVTVGSDRTPFKCFVTLDRSA